MTEGGANMAEGQAQRAYYQQTAGEYDQHHLGEESEHYEALVHITGYARALNARSILDVGAGTGRALSFLQAQLPGDTRLAGVEPVPELIAEARKKGLAADLIREGDGRRLPFRDQEFDFVIETGMLHHTPEPGQVVKEMLRVARLAAFFSDSNRFGQGRLPVKLLKLALCKTRLWPAFEWVRTRGRGYMESAGDGVFYSYSLYDNLDEIRASAERVSVMSLGTSASAEKGLLSPLLSSSAVLVSAFKGRPRIS